jgi:hypothetical protein
MASNRTYAVFGTAVLMASLAGPVAAQEPTIEVVAQGLDNPRGVAVAADGSLYVAEAGITGDTCLEDAAVGDSEGGGLCYGPTGAISHITADGQERVVDGLISVGSAQDNGGVSDVAPADDGTLYYVMNLGADPAIREGMPAELQDAGWLMKVAPGGTPERVADVAAFETANDPDAAEGGEVDSNPYALAITDSSIAIADAGGNDVLHVADDGTVSLIASIPVTMHEYSAEELAAMGGPAEGGAPDEAMPAESGAPDEAMPAESGAPDEAMPAGQEMVPVPVQAVPTSVTVGPDGALYVGQLTGGPFPVGGASVWRVADGEEPTEYATGFTNIMGLGFAPDGTLYVAELVHEGLMGVFAGGQPPIGAVLSVAPGGGEPTLLATGEQFMALGGLDVDADGAVYVSTGTILGAGAGTVVKITP